MDSGVRDLNVCREGCELVVNLKRERLKLL